MAIAESRRFLDNDPTLDDEIEIGLDSKVLTDEEFLIPGDPTLDDELEIGLGIDSRSRSISRRTFEAEND